MTLKLAADEHILSFWKQKYVLLIPLPQLFKALKHFRFFFSFLYTFQQAHIWNITNNGVVSTIIGAFGKLVDFTTYQLLFDYLFVHVAPSEDRTHCTVVMAIQTSLTNHYPIPRRPRTFEKCRKKHYGSLNEL